MMSYGFPMISVGCHLICFVSICYPEFCLQCLSEVFLCLPCLLCSILSHVSYDSLTMSCTFLCFHRFSDAFTMCSYVCCVHPPHLFQVSPKQLSIYLVSVPDIYQLFSNNLQTFQHIPKCVLNIVSNIIFCQRLSKGV